MAKAMTKSQVTEHLAGKVGITKKAAGEFLDHLAALAHREAKNTFTMPGIGKLVLVNRKARMGRNPQTGEALSQELRDRIAKNAKFQLAEVLRARGLESGAIRTLFGWTDSRDALGHQIEDEVRNNSWYRALDMLNPSVSGTDPQMIARAMANVLNLSANQIEARRYSVAPLPHYSVTTFRSPVTSRPIPSATVSF